VGDNSVAGTGDRTVRNRLVDAVEVPEVPVIVKLYCPGIAAVLATRVSSLLKVVRLGLKDAVTPLGRPEMKRLTLPVKP
jgi:hypothetical protein